MRSKAAEEETMKMSLKKLPLYLVTASMALGVGSAMADRPEWAGRRGDGDRDERRDDDRRDRRDYRDDDRHDRRGDYRAGPQVQINIGGYFGDRHREAVRDYYREEYRGGHCPPGLAKKNNGCLPPGQARQWAVGRPLPRDVAYYPVEPQVRVRLGTPPAGYEFVRVAGDILLIAVGTSMVMDAIQDIQGR